MVPDADGNENRRVVLKLHPRLAPIKVAILPLVKKEGLPEIAREIVSDFFKAGINVKYDEIMPLVNDIEDMMKRALHIVLQLMVKPKKMAL